ncbi:MAG: hypothetical protein ACOC00_03110 [Halothiobacillaceae bacterium]
MNVARLTGLALALVLIGGAVVYYEMIRGSNIQTRALAPVQEPAPNPGLARLEDRLASASANLEMLEAAASERRMTERLTGRNFLAQVPREPESMDEDLAAEAEVEDEAERKAREAAAESVAVEPPPPPMLQMVFMAEERARALIDGQLYMLGDALESGGVISAITPETVEIERGDELLVLKMNGELRVGRIHP